MSGNEPVSPKSRRKNEDQSSIFIPNFIFHAYRANADIYLYPLIPGQTQFLFVDCLFNKYRERSSLETAQIAPVSLPFPSRWGINADIEGRPIIWGILFINSIADQKVSGMVNFRGTAIPINGYWNENTKQIRFDSPYATFTGQLGIFDDIPIKIRHLILRGQFIMYPPSLQAGEQGSWIATTDTNLTGSPIKSDSPPPVGVFLTSDLLSGSAIR